MTWLVSKRGTRIYISYSPPRLLCIGILNLRGSDIEYNPVFFAYVLITEQTVQLYLLDASRIDAKLTAHFDSENCAVSVHEYSDIADGITALLKANHTARVLLSNPNQALLATVPDGRYVLEPSPVNRMKVVKNAIEAKGMRRAHVRDGVALIKYLHWLDGHIDTQTVTEMSGAEQLARFRAYVC